MLQEFIMIPLDVFRALAHNKINKKEAWLYFVGSDSPRDIGRIIEAYPEFKELYGQLAMLRYRTKELIEMYDEVREALRVADENTVQYMVERLQNEVEELKIDNIKKLKEKDAIIEEKDTLLEEKETLLEEKDTMIKMLKEQLEKMNK